MGDQLSMNNQLIDELIDSVEKQRILDLTVDLICIAGTDGYLKYVNPAWEKTLGYTQEELLAQPLRSFIHPNDHSKKIDEVFKLTYDELTIDFENRYIHKDGSIRTISWRVAPLPEKGLLYCIGRDITERKAMENQLIESEEKYRLLFENAKEAIAVLDKEGRYQFLNKAAVKMLGSTEKNLINKKIKELFPRKIANKKMSILKGIFKSGKGYMHETWIPIQRKNICLHQSLEPVIDSNGNVTSVLSISTDITDLKKSEEALKDAREEWKNIFEAIGHPAVILDPDHNIIAANKKVLKLTEQELENLKNKKCYDVFHHPNSSKAHERCPMEKMMESGKLETVEMELEALGGIYLVSCTPVLDEKGKLEKIIHIATDITARKQAENAINKEHQKAQEYLDIAGVMIIAIDATGKITLINRKGCEILGYREEEIIGKNWFENFVPKYVLRSIKPISKNLLNGKINNAKYFENHILTKNGEKRLIAWHNTILRDEEGHIIGHLSSGEDITDKRRAEEQIQKDLREKEVLLKEIHHRVKNNLQVISSLLSLQSMKIKEKNVLNIFNESRNRVRSMALVHEELYHSKDLAHIDFHSYVKNLVNSLYRVYKSNSASIQLKLDIENMTMGIDLAVPCGLIINELISNSLKYAFPKPHRKKVLIQVSLHDLGNNRAELIVKDNGIGFPKEIHNENRSLGLHLVTLLAEDQLGGTIQLKRSNGTTFKITFQNNPIDL